MGQNTKEFILSFKVSHCHLTMSVRRLFPGGVGQNFSGRGAKTYYLPKNEKSQKISFWAAKVGNAPLLPSPVDVHAAFDHLII